MCIHLSRVTPSKHHGTLAVTMVHPDMHVFQGLAVEIWLTFNLLLTVHGCTYSGRKTHKFMFTIPIGMAVMVAVLSGVSLQPNSSQYHTMCTCNAFCIEMVSCCSPYQLEQA